MLPCSSYFISAVNPEEALRAQDQRLKSTELAELRAAQEALEAENEALVEEIKAEEASCKAELAKFEALSAAVMQSSTALSE